MGQQQLLLIVLGVIVVGIAVVVGINLFNANAETSTQDSIVSQGTNLGAMAQQYYKKPVSMGGGGNSFLEFDTKVFAALPQQLRISHDADWTQTAPAVAADNIVLTAYPIDDDYAARWHVVTTVTKDSINTIINVQAAP
jgi:hypothetical protein